MSTLQSIPTFRKASPADGETIELFAVRCDSGRVIQVAVYRNSASPRFLNDEASQQAAKSLGLPWRGLTARYEKTVHLVNDGRRI